MSTSPHETFSHATTHLCIRPSSADRLVSSTVDRISALCCTAGCSQHHLLHHGLFLHLCGP